MSRKEELVSSNTSMREKEWVHQYDMLKHKIRSIRQLGNPCQQNDITDLNTNVEFLVKGLKMMQNSPMEYEISASELARRETITDNLRKQITMIPLLGKKLGSSGPGPGFGIEMENPTSFPNSSTPSARDSETMNPMSASNKGLVLRQQEIIRMQDEMLEDISKGVEVLHHQAIHIGEEAKSQTKILNDLDTQVDKAAEGLKKEAQHAETIRIKSNICGMYICILIEVIIIVILLIIWFTQK